jgi:hypothetical protein
MNRNYSAKTLKMLWGRSGNLCALPECRMNLIINHEETGGDSVIGTMDHIVAIKGNGPRGEADLPEKDRDEYSNLILLCSNCHKIVDDNPDIYTVEKLIELKNKHEKWVSETLEYDNKKEEAAENYAYYIDEFIRLANFDNWMLWISNLFMPIPTISLSQYDKLIYLTKFMLGRTWFCYYPEIKISLENFTNVLNDLLKVFNKYADFVPSTAYKSIITKPIDDLANAFGKNKELKQNEGFYRTNQFYKANWCKPEESNRLFTKYDYHVKLIHDLTMELTRAANHIIDKVRENILSSFRIKEGMLLVEIGPFIDNMQYYTFKFEYKDNQKKELYPGLKKFMEIRTERDFRFGNGISKDYP